MIELSGMTWRHARGYEPMVATADAYMSAHQGVRIQWEARSLQDFADYSITALAERFDLLVIDHPFVGVAQATGCLLPLDEYLSRDVLAEQEAASVGPSNASYVYGGHQWALAIDAASQVSAYRADLLQHSDLDVPQTWDDVLSLARKRRRCQRGQVAVPLIPVDSLMCFYTLCANAGEEPYSSETHVVSRAVGRYALDTLLALYAYCHPSSLTWNPPLLLEQMSSTDDIVYCPLLFGYSNYARPTVRPALIRFTNLPAHGGGPRGAVLGGAGLAISSRTEHRDIACDYAAYVASATAQRTVYFGAGGQPGHRAAWTDPQVNAASSRFFLDTLDTLDRAYLRPRYNGYMELQDRAGTLLHAFLQERGNPDTALDSLDAIYQASQTGCRRRR